MKKENVPGIRTPKGSGNKERKKKQNQEFIEKGKIKNWAEHKQIVVTLRTIYLSNKTLRLLWTKNF